MNPPFTTDEKRNTRRPPQISASERIAPRRSRSVPTICVMSAAWFLLVSRPGCADDKRPTTAEALPSATKIIDDFIEATGGREVRKKLHTRVMSGTLTHFQRRSNTRLSGPYTTYEAEPNRNYRLWEPVGLGEFDWGTDGQTAWEITPRGGPRNLEGEEKATTLRYSTFHFELEWPRLYKKIECTDVKYVEGRAYYAVTMTPHEGKPEILYFDKETKLLISREVTLASPTGPIRVAVAYRDYKEVDGLLMPHTFAQRSANADVVYTFEKITHNVDIPKERFELPDVIKVLLEKKEKERPTTEPSAPKGARP